MAVAALAALTLGAGQPDLPECVVTLRDGKRLSGLLVERTEDRVVIRVGSIDTTFTFVDVQRIDVLPPLEERYNQMRSTIADDDAEGIVRLARWLCSRGRYDLAQIEVSRALRASPEHPAAMRMQDEISGMLELIRKRQAREGDTELQPDPPADSADADEPPEGDDTSLDSGEIARARAEWRRNFPRLTPEQINLVKVFEIDLSDPPRMRIDRATIDRLIQRYAGSDLIPTTREGRDALYRKPPAQILELMFRLRARELYEEVRVLDQPRSMRLFRDNVHATWLVSACATTDCHGGYDAGRLQMLAGNRRGEDAVYTNFYIIEKATLKDGTPLINYDQPGRSPLLHMALPRSESLYPHPEVYVRGERPAWKPVFRSMQDPGYVRALEWISSMYRPRPEYPIEYVPPTPPAEPPPPASEPVPR
jgi:hypothetical protein